MTISGFSYSSLSQLDTETAAVRITSLVLILQRWGRTRANLKHQVDTWWFDVVCGRQRPADVNFFLPTEWMSFWGRLFNS